MKKTPSTHKKTDLAQKKGSSFSIGAGVVIYWFALAIGGFVALISWPIVVIGMLGLVPAWVMFYLDKNPFHIGFFSVLIPNLAAVVFVCIDFLLLPKMGGRTSQLLLFLSKPVPWIAMYVPGSFAIFLHTQISELIQQSKIQKSQNTIEKCKARQEELSEIWGTSLKS